MNEFHFLRPYWFLALPFLLGALWLLWRRRLRSRSWQEICDPALLPHLLLGRSRRRANWPLWLMLAAVLMVVVALAGPTWRRLPQPMFRQQSALVICLDLSNSMLAADLKPSRLVRARLKVQDILRQRREGQTALVAFAGDAFALTPLTDDSRTIESLLGSLEPSLMPVQGSSPARALALAAELLQQAGLQNGTVLLVTDEDRPLLAGEEARRLTDQGVQLQVLGVGTPEGAPIPLAEGGFFKDRAGNLVLPRLDEAALRQLAGAGGGSYRRISIDDDDFHALLAELESRRLDLAEAAQDRLGDRWEEAGVWLLVPLLLLSACAFRRGWLAVFVLLLLSPPQARAMSWQDLWQSPDRQAGSAFEAGQYEDAAGRFKDPRWKASALYRAGRYGEAIEALPDPQSADDWYNRGNGLARSGKLSEALEAYDQALALKPDDEDALFNRKLVEEALEKQKQDQSEEKTGDQGESDSSDQQKGDGKQKSDGQGEQNGADQENREGDGKGSQGEEGSSPSQTPEQGDRQAQQQEEERSASETESGEQTGSPSDRQKEAQGQQAESGDEQPQEGDRAAAAAENEPPSAEEREMQQWLQTIPDDPGGLLRRKFLYQYRRRGEQLETDRPW